MTQTASTSPSGAPQPRIGFIGNGVMGGPMAGHLARAGYAVTVFDVHRPSAQAVAEAHPGVAVADSPAAVGARSDIVITMLPSGAYVRDVALGAQGLIETLAPGSLLLDTSSCEPWITVETARALAERGIDMVDAPVSGARWGAEAAELVFMVGGTAANLERVRPLLERMGRRHFLLGPTGAGHAMKCLNNTMTAMTFLATMEGMAIGKRFGLDPDAMIDVLNISTGGSWITENHIRQRVISGRFDDPFKLHLMIKDVGIAMELAARTDTPAPYSGLGHQLWKAAGLQNPPDASVSELARWVEKMADVQVRP